MDNRHFTRPIETMVGHDSHSDIALERGVDMDSRIPPTEGREPWTKGNESAMESGH